ncbi:MAG: UDP-N-acetylmuramoyl-L-alanine--D-glutamate ligase [Candidatus Delongbacteria bacterium]|nr:UDP-N-acetylmuramoyl-L-alanine--D-glutamate ligase [Candidatus Delongbacteria bacterium]
MSVLKMAKYFEDKSVLIMGLGVEGMSTLDFLKNHFPKTKIAVYDRKPVRLGKDVRFITGNISDIMDKFDLIIKSPGIPLPNDFVLRNRQIISSQTDLFLREFNQQTIGVTGTKGKSTTVTLLHNILTSSGRNSILAGNIGVPVFDIIEETDDTTTVVLELSSHQLQYIKKAPHISAILNVYPEHLDFYKNFIEYRSAKLNIVRFQSEDDQIVFPIKEFSGLERNSVSVPFEIILDGDDVIVYYWKNSIVLSKKCIELKGLHNLYNIGTALILSQLAGCETADAVQTVYEFKGLEHRLEFFGKFREIEFYNDSISTIPQATAAALRSLDNMIGTLILGGHFRGDEIVWDTLTEEIKKSFIQNIIFLPETGPMIFEHLLQSGFEENGDGNITIQWHEKRTNCYFCSDFNEIIPLIFEKTPKNSVCLLSPASSSYNMFKNFEERGSVFKKLVKEFTNGEKS